jgi:hypothetical protein
VVLDKAKAGAADVEDVKFLQERLPEGLELSGQTLAVKAGYEHKLIGKLAYSNVIIKLDPRHGS